MHKDIRLALEAAREPRIPLPAASAADSVLSHAEEIGYGHRDGRRALSRLMRGGIGAP